MTALETERRPAIIRTERGLIIEGTRITLCDVTNYVLARYPSKFIPGLFELAADQTEVALLYIETSRAEVEAEYKQVIKEAEELRLYYEEQNKERLAQISLQPPKPGAEAAWEKLRAAKAKRQLAT